MQVGGAFSRRGEAGRRHQQRTAEFPTLVRIYDALVLDVWTKTLNYISGRSEF